MEETARSILDQVPDVVDIGPVVSKYPVMYEQSMNTVLIQEVIRFNNLLGTIKNSLNDLLKALKGLVVMSQALEEMANSLFINQVPEMWKAKVRAVSLQRPSLRDGKISGPVFFVSCLE